MQFKDVHSEKLFIELHNCNVQFNWINLFWLFILFIKIIYFAKRKWNQMESNGTKLKHKFKYKNLQWFKLKSIWFNSNDKLTVYNWKDEQNTKLIHGN